MERAGQQLRPLLIEWSPKRVRALDPSTRQLRAGASLAECMEGSQSGRDAIISISHRSAFIRSMFVPKAGPAEVKRILEIQLASVLPLGAGEYAFGYRLGREVHGKGLTAVVGAIKADSLRRIHQEAAELGLRVQAVLPVAFGSWLAAKERNINECIIVETDGETVNLDVIHEGEIHYSRSIPMPESPEELEAEVARTFAIAGLPPAPVFSTGCPGIHADITYTQEPIEYLADVHVIRKHLFTIELTVSSEARQERAERVKAVRAIVAAAAAIGMGAFAYSSRLPAKIESKPTTAGSRAAMNKARAKESAAKAELASAKRANKILDVAFNPGQSISDVVKVLSLAAPRDSWLTNLTIARGAPISVSGLALTDGDVAMFVAAVSSDPRFQEMKVISSNKALIGKRQVTQFLVLGKTRGLLAFDRPSKGKKGA
jgi:hypothetical protein